MILYNMCIISETIINYSIEINMCRVTPFFLYFTLVFTAATQGMIRRMHGNISADGSYLRMMIVVVPVKSSIQRTHKYTYGKCCI